MATTTDMSDNVAADAAIAEQIAVDDLLLDTSNEIVRLPNFLPQPATISNTIYS